MSPIAFLAFSGSTRAGSYNTQLAAAMVARASALGAQATLVSLADHPAPLYDSDWEDANGVPEPIVGLYRLLAAQDAVFIASPEYNGGYTPLLKNTIDWLSRVKADGRHAFRDPLYSLGAASPGAQGGLNGLHALRPTINRLGAITMPEQLTIASAGSAFGEDGDFTNERTQSLAQAQLTRLFAVAGKLRG